MIKYFKYAVFIFIAGILFTLGSVFAMFYVFPLFSGPTSNLHEDIIAETEQAIGMPCEQVYTKSMDFVREDVRKIIDVGMAGGDWVESVSGAQKQFIDRTADRTLQCQTLEYSAAQEGIDWHDFSELTSIFSALRMQTTSYGGEPASSRYLKRSALERLIRSRDLLVDRQ